MESNDPIKKLQQLARQFGTKEKSVPEQKETKKEMVSYQEAQEIMGPNFYGIDEILRTFAVNINVNEIPKIPFNKQELKQAKMFGQDLILYIDETRDGTKLNITELKKRYRVNEAIEQDSFLFLLDEKHITTDAILQRETPRLGWRLTEQSSLSESYNKNYLEQTELLVGYLQKNMPSELPKLYQIAITEFEALKESLRPLVVSGHSDSQKMAAEALSLLSINQLCRENFIEVLYRIALYKNRYNTYSSDLIKLTMTNSIDSNSSIILVDNGGRIGWWDVVRTAPGIGICFSRGI